MRWFTAAFAATVAVALGGCAGAPLTSAQSAPQVRHLGSSQCPCLYVANAIYKNHTDSPRITVYAQGASGNATPIQEIKGSNTGLEYPIGVAVDQSDNIYVANYTGATNHYGSITVYSGGATGNVPPTATISGSNTELYAPQGVAINPVNGDIYVSNANSATVDDGTITIYAPGSNGNVAPLGVIQHVGNPFGLTLDENANVYVAVASGDGGPNAIEVYAPSSSGDSLIRTIQGSLTELDDPTGVALDSNLNVYVANYNHESDSLTVYAARANGNVTPIQRIDGSRTKLDTPFGIAVDNGGNIYASNLYADTFSSSTATIYAAGANGNKKPIRAIKGGKTGLAGPYGIAIH